MNGDSVVRASRTKTTGSIRIETRFRSDALSDFTPPVEICTSDLTVIAHTRGGQVVDGLTRGEKYFVTAQLPGGRSLTTEVTIPLSSRTPLLVVLAPTDTGKPPSGNDEVRQLFGNSAATVLPEAATELPAQWNSPAATLESLGPSDIIPPAPIDDRSDIDALLGDYLRSSASPVSSPPGLETQGPAAQGPTDVPPPPTESVNQSAVFEYANRPETAEFVSDRAEIQVRLFHGNPLALACAPQMIDGIDVERISRSVLQLTIPVADEEGLWYLQALQAGHPASNVALPISTNFGCAVTLSRVPGGSAVGQESDAVSLDVHMANVEANATARYRALGFASDASMSLHPDANALDAGQLIGQGAEQDPVAAAVGCYALLRFNCLDELDESTDSLRRTFPWFPDGAAIRGEYLARLGRHDEALEAFLEVADRGLPLFNEGLGFMMERLDLYRRASEPSLTPAQVERVRGLLPLLQRYSAVTDFDKALLRFHGLTPNTPGSEPTPATAAPADPTRLDLTFNGQTDVVTTPEKVRVTEALQMPFSATDVLATTEARYSERTPERTVTGRKIEAARASGGSILSVDDPQRVALRTQRVLAQPIVREALGATTAGETLEALGVVEGDHLLERILGGNNLLGISFLELGTTVSHSVGRIQVNDQFRTREFGTGFMVSPRLILTNNHVLPDAESARFSQVEFNFQNGIDGRALPSHLFELQPGVLFLTDAELDFTIVAVSPESRDNPPVPLARFGFNRASREQGKVVLGESINIIQHPSGHPKQIALQQNELIDRLDHFLHYHSDTSPGSSGAPLYNNQWEIVGLHHSGVPDRDPAGNILAVDGTLWTEDLGESKIKWLANEGARISSILTRIDEASAAMPPEQQRLVGQILNPPTTVVLPPSETGPNAAPEIQAGTSVVPAVESASGSVSLTIPLHITVRLGDTAV